MSKAATNKNRNNISGKHTVEAAGRLSHTGRLSHYPFGMRINGQHYYNGLLSGVEANKFLYNGKELQDQTGYYDYGFRQYEAQLGRWHVIDAMAEKYTGTSPYVYVMNNPVNNVDIMGLWSIPVYVNGVLDHYVYGDGGWDTGQSTFGTNDLPGEYAYGSGGGGEIMGLSSSGSSGSFSMYSIYLNSEAYGRGMWYSTWIDKQNKAAQEQGIGSARLAYMTGYSFEAEYGNSFAGFGGNLRFAGTYIKKYIAVKNGYSNLKYGYDSSNGPDRNNFWGAGGSGGGNGDGKKNEDKSCGEGFFFKYKTQYLSPDKAEKYLNNDNLFQNIANGSTGIVSATAYTLEGGKATGLIGVFNGSVMAAEDIVKQSLQNDVKNNYDGSGLIIETWTTWHGTYSFSITISYVKNSNGTLIGYIWQ